MTYIFISLVIEIVNIIFDANYYVPRFSKVFPRYTAFLAVKSILVAESGNSVKRSDTAPEPVIALVQDRNLCDRNQEN